MTFIHVASRTFAVSSLHPACLLVLAPGSGRLTSVDVSDPTAPTLAGSVDGGISLRQASGLALQGTHAFVTCDPHRLAILSVTDIANPLLIDVLHDSSRIAGTSAIVTRF